MNLNMFAEGTAPIDMAATDEFRSLLQSATDLGLEHDANVRYLSRNTILRHQRFHLLEWGDPAAPPLILLHGGHQSAHSWDLVSLHFANRFHIYALDQRGHGDSEWARDSDYSVDAMVEDALAFIESERIERPLIFGHSMGGMVTMGLLKRRPDLPRAAVLVDVGPELSSVGTAMIGGFIQSVVEFDDIETFVAKVQAYDPFRSREHIERTVRYNMLRRADGKYISKCDFSPARRRFSEGQRSDVPRAVTLEDVASFPLPVLVVRGAESNVLEADAAERFVAAMPQGELVTVPACGHNVHSQNTPGFLEAVTPFAERATP